MKKFSLLLSAMILFVFALSLSACSLKFFHGTVGAPAYEDEASYSVGDQTYEGEISSLYVHWYVGKVILSESESGEISVQESGKDLPEEKKVRSRLQDGQLSVMFWKADLHASVDERDKQVTIVLPKNLDITVVNMSAEFYSDKLTANHLSIDTTSGSITLGDVSANSCKISLTSGKLTYKSLTSPKIGLSANSGTITGDSLSASESCTVAVTSGTINLKKLDAPTSTLQANSGSVFFKLSERCEEVTASVTSGAMIAELPPAGGIVSFVLSTGKFIGVRSFTQNGNVCTFGDGTCRLKLSAGSGIITVK